MVTRNTYLTELQADGFSNNYSQKCSVCAAAAAAGALLAAGLGTAARKPRPRRRRPNNSNFFNFLIFGSENHSIFVIVGYLSKIFGPEHFGPKLLRTDSERSPNGPRTEPERTSN